ncbi:MAG: prepilin-type N-terminal cleavage/methylation domain-containing protein, partial [Bacilli bacterium]|nr:prepilin-type N-terminal cleavage/methylation domain-containing protein [Bacilli bacterium]MBQ9181659.1 prepilin-type N-terminal cleavage/methylation domain-containing protein [Bacilli bacterium]
MKKKKGFTLIELLAVIVILAVLAVITVVIIGNVIEDAKI